MGEPGNIVASAGFSRALVWGEISQCELLARALQGPARAGAGEGSALRVVMAGSPAAARSVEFVGAFSSALGAVRGSTSIQVVDDLRKALRTGGVDVALLAAPGDFCDGDHDADDRAAIESARRAGVRVFSFEPMPASLLQLETPKLTVAGEDDPRASNLLNAAGVMVGDAGSHSQRSAEAGSSGGAAESGGHAGQVSKSGQAATLETLGGWAAFCPCARVSRVVREAVELIEHVGPVRAMSVECLGQPEHGSLGARLFDGLDLVASFMGVAETVDAAFAPVARGRNVHSVPSQRLRRLDGSMTAHARFADGRSASIVASNRAGGWSRRVVMICDTGRAVLTDDRLDWIGVSGGDGHAPGDEVSISRSTGRAAATGSAEQASDAGVAAIGEALERMLDPRGGAGAAGVMPTDYPAVLALCGAALLSARTGEAESPATILRMARGG